MDCEVVVVGGGIGGLTVAALLAQRGVDVCLLERESRVGGCAASFEKFGYNFEPGYGLFTAWEPEGIHARVFSELPVEPPEVRPLEPGLVVRLPDHSEISLAAEKFESDLRRVFPECAEVAVAFYRELAPVAAALRHGVQRSADFLATPKSGRIFSLLREGRVAAEIMQSGKIATSARLTGASLRFRRFIDAQLQVLAQGNSTEVPYLSAALALSGARGGLYALRGGADALANTLADSIKKSGGSVRLDTPVLRLSYSSSGVAVGVDLLSGEKIRATKALVSNLTLWDTYGKLVGLSRTPPEIRKHLNALRGWGAYLLYVALDETAANPSAPEHLIALTEWQADQDFSPETNQLVFSAAPRWDSRAPQGHRAVTVSAFTNVDDWFTFHKDETALEAKDQQMLEACWAGLHGAMPELGSSVEVIETATPRSFYDSTRRKLGMVGGTVPSPDRFWPTAPNFETSLPNLFVISDTTSSNGIAGLTRSAFTLANKLTR